MWPPPLPSTSDGVLLLSPHSSVHVRPQIHVPAQRGEHLYLQVGDGLGGGGQGRRGHGAVQQRVGGVAAWRVCRLPVGLQVIGQVFTRVLQLVLVQDDVKQFLRHKTQTRLLFEVRPRGSSPQEASVRTYRWALSQLISCNHLHVQVLRLRLPSGFNEPLENLKHNKLHNLKLNFHP